MLDGVGAIAMSAFHGRTGAATFARLLVAAVFAATFAGGISPTAGHTPVQHGYAWTCDGGQGHESTEGTCYDHQDFATARWYFFDDPSANPEAAIRQGAADWDRTFSHEFDFLPDQGGGSPLYWRGSDPCGVAGWYGCAVTVEDTAQHIIENQSRIELESDIGWNATISGNCSPTQLDLWSGAAHEFGHLAGLGHSSQSSATMYYSMGAGDCDQRILSTHDRLGRCQIYGHSHAYWGGCGDVR